MHNVLARINIPLRPLAAVLGLVITASLLIITFNYMLDSKRSVYNREAALIHDVILQNLNAAEEAAYGLRAFFNASTYVDADEFSIVSGDILARHNIISGLMYMPLVRSDERHKFEASFRDEGNDTFSINQYEGLSFLPAAMNSHYFPVKYFESVSPNNTFPIGLDLLSDDALKPFIQRAIETAGVSVSAPQPLHNNKYLVFQALYTDRQASPTAVDRGKMVSGLLALVVDLKKLRDDVPQYEHLEYTLTMHSILDNGSVAELLVGGDVDHLEHHQAVLTSFTLQYDIQTGEQSYQLEINKALHWEGSVEPPIIIALLTGLMFTSLLIWLSVIITSRAKELQQRNEEVNALVKVRTHELATANENLQKVAIDLDTEKRHQQALLKKHQSTHTQLLHSEKMASIGQLAAGVAHEINNPVGYVNSNLGSLRDYIMDLFRMIEAYEKGYSQVSEGADANDVRNAMLALKESLDLTYMKNDLIDLIEESKEGLGRVKVIVQDLKEFSHMGDVESQLVDLHCGLDSTLNIVNNELKYKAEIVKVYGDLPLVECMPSQINQVLLNILVNASHAMEENGTLTIRTGCKEQWVWIEIEDTGKGIEPEVKKRIFEPFFTTKGVGDGTGLGLSVSFGIIENHGGRIEVESTVGVGSLFRIWLPVHRAELVDDAIGNVG